MAYSTILFLRRGSKKKTRMGKTERRKSGRLFVGICVRNWSKVFYEPSDDADRQDDDDMPAVYYFEGQKNGSKRREPAPGEIAWLPHFDPAHIQMQGPGKERQKALVHRRTLYDAYRYLDEDDPDEVAILEEELNDVNHRRWQSLFDDAKGWKKADLRARGKRGDRRRALLISQGKNPGENQSDGSSDDSAYYGEGPAESDEDEDDVRGLGMPPPPRPPVRSNAGSAQGAKRRRVDSPNGGSSSGTVRTHLSNLGRLPGQPRARGRPAMLRGQARQSFQEDSGSENGIFMSGASNGDIQRRFLRNRGHPRSPSANVLDGRLDDLRLPSASPDFDPRPPGGGGVGPSQDESRWVPTDDYQDGEDEDDALQRAMRESVAPHEQQSYLQTPSATGSRSMHAGETPPEGFQAATDEAIRRSLLPDETEAQVEAAVLEAMRNSVADADHDRTTQQGQNTPPASGSARRHESINRALPNNLASQGQASFHATVEDDDETETKGRDGGNGQRGAEAG